MDVDNDQLVEKTIENVEQDFLSKRLTHTERLVAIKSTQEDPRNLAKGSEFSAKLRFAFNYLSLAGLHLKAV